MAKFHVSKSVSISATPERVFTAINDYHQWPAWSPWLILEKGVTINVKENGKEFSWVGNRTGSGEMKVLSENAHQRVDMQLTFLKPWKSTSKVWFELKPEGNQTTLTWGMEGSLPFFLFWMKAMMSAYIGMDYERGLTMLKDYVETGEVPSKLAFDGITDFAGCNYVGVRAACDMDALQTQMSTDFKRLESWGNDYKELIIAPPFSIYHKWDMVKRKVEYTSACPVSEVPASTPSGFISGMIPATKVNTITHTGAYRHLGNAWSAQYNMHRAKEFKVNKKVHPFEIYLTMPGTVPEKELVTVINFPTS